MKKIFILFIVATFFASCEKEMTTQLNSIKDANSEIAFVRIPKIKIKIKIYIDGGTRKTADEYNDLDIGDGSNCQGRGFCLGLAANTADDEIIAGHATLAPADFTPAGSGYVFGLTELEESFEFSVHPDDITAEQKDIVFEGDVFELDYAYFFKILSAISLASKQYLSSPFNVHLPVFSM